MIPPSSSADRLAFEAFHRAHPGVLDAFAGIARELRDRGVPPKTASVWTLIHRWRWLTMVDRAQGPIAGVGQPSVRSAHAPFYARALHAACPDLDGYLQLAPMKDDYKPDLLALGIVALPPPPPLPGLHP